MVIRYLQPTSHYTPTRSLSKSYKLVGVCEMIQSSFTFYSSKFQFKFHLCMSMMFHGCTGGPHHGWWTSFTLCSHGFLKAGEGTDGAAKDGWRIQFSFFVEVSGGTSKYPSIYLSIYTYIYLNFNHWARCCVQIPFSSSNICMYIYIYVYVQLKSTVFLMFNHVFTP